MEPAWDYKENKENKHNNSNIILILSVVNLPSSFLSLVYNMDYKSFEEKH